MKDLIKIPVKVERLWKGEVSNANVVCPYCFETVDDGAGWGDDGAVRCRLCGRRFFWIVKTARYFTTTKAEG